VARVRDTGSVWGRRDLAGWILASSRRVRGLGGDPLRAVDGRDDLVGFAIPRNVKSLSSVPAVSKSTVPTRRTLSSRR
jgi:hypothetical protein